MTDLFAGSDYAATDVDPTKDYFSELVGDGKKFKTQSDLARGKYEADLFVEQLKREKEQLRQDYLKLHEESAARAKLADLIDQLRTERQPSSSNQPLANVDTPKPAFDPKELESLVDTKIEQREIYRTQDQNFKHVQDKLKERWGPNYSNVLKTQIEQLKLPADYINDLARRSPEAFFRTVGFDTKPPEPFQAPPRGSTSSSNAHAAGPQKRTWSYYQELRKNNPRLYLDPKINAQMDRDHQTLGAAFEDGDFHS